MELQSRPPQHYQTTTLIAAVRLQAPQAPGLFEGPMDGELFLAWVKQGLAPVLQRDDMVTLHDLWKCSKRRNARSTCQINFVTASKTSSIFTDAIHAINASRVPLMSPPS